MYTIMIVDDEMAIRENLPKAILFEEHGFRVISKAKNGQDAFDLLPKVKPDVILLDVAMPTLDGLGFLEKLRNSEYRKTIVILLSGYSDFACAKTAMRFGVRAYLNKPIDEEEIYPLLDEICVELQEQERESSRGTLQTDMDTLVKLYNSVTDNRDNLSNYMLLHCVALQMNTSFEEENPFQVIQECLSEELNSFGNCFFRSRGSVFTYLIPNVILSKYGDMVLFAKHILYQLKQKKMICALLFDDSIFNVSHSTFRDDYSCRLYTMQTDIFYNMKNYVIYKEVKDDYKLLKLHMEDEFVDNLRSNLLQLNKEVIDSKFKELITNIRSMNLRIEYIQEISYRIYYLLIDVISSINNTYEEEALLQPPLWLDNPFFVTFDKWISIVKGEINSAYEFIEKSKKMSNLGICGEVIEYVHRHYTEPITIKQVADMFYLNPVYLGRTFQKATGVSFKQYVNELRINEAKRLLSQTDKLIYEIADELGYTESKYFIQKFTAEVGISPTEYRKSK